MQNAKVPGRLPVTKYGVQSIWARAYARQAPKRLGNVMDDRALEIVE
jgi:hypothetical protein